VETHLYRNGWRGWGGGGVDFTRTSLFTGNLMLKVWLNDKIVGLTDLNKTHRKISFLFAVLKVM
jgi:hypothetical protein